jgi:hypothetical protein
MMVSTNSRCRHPRLLSWTWGMCLCALRFALYDTLHNAFTMSPFNKRLQEARQEGFRGAMHAIQCTVTCHACPCSCHVCVTHTYMSMSQ